MSISLNLLSPAQKEAIETRVIYALIERLMLLLVAACGLVTLVLLGIRMELTRSLADVVSRQVLSKEYASVNQDTAKLNGAIAHVQKLETLAVPPSEALFDIYRRTSAHVRLNSLSYDVRGHAMSLSGTSDTRDDLLGFEESLRGSPYVQSLESPVSNLFEKTNVNFTMQIVIHLPPPQAVQAATSTTP